MFVAV